MDDSETFEGRGSPARCKSGCNDHHDTPAGSTTNGSFWVLRFDEIGLSEKIMQQSDHFLAVAVEKTKIPTPTEVSG